MSQHTTSEGHNNDDQLTELINPCNCEEFMKHLQKEADHVHSNDHHGHSHSHDHHGHDHSHAPQATWRLVTMICLNVVFLLAELITGFITHSLSLQSDAFHMISDEASLCIGLAAHKLSKRPPDRKMTFGWTRTEVVGGFVNAVFLLAICLMLFCDVIERFIDPPEIEKGLLFLIVGCLGLLINIVGMFVFHNHSHSDNLKGVFLHVMGDFFGSIGVVISACVVNFTNWKYKMYVDPVISLIIIAILVYGSAGLFKTTGKIIIERVPDGIDTEKIEEQLLMIPHLEAVHELHVWELSRDNVISLVHIVVSSRDNSQVVLEMVHNLMLTFKIYSSTVQIEYSQDFPPQFSDTANSCFYASSVGKDKRVFVSKPIYQHSIGCPHFINPNDDEHSHDHDHDHHDHDHKHDHDHHDHKHDHDHHHNHDHESDNDQEDRYLSIDENEPL